MDTFEALMSDTAAYLGFDGLEPDENGICEIISEEAQIIVMGCPEAEDAVLVTAKITETADSDKFPDALRANHRFSETKGSTVSIDPDENAFVLSMHRPLHTLDGEKMARLLEEFMTVLLALREELA